MTSPSGGRVVHRLYEAFQARDGAAMQACYADDATFRDPVFDLQGARRIGGMWQMLLDGGPDLVVEVVDIESDAVSGRARWEARYTFSATARPVHNLIDATFTIHADRITTHVDDFGFWRWSRQALGPTGQLLGWTPSVRSQVQRRAARSLDRYLAG
ncbi:nuclear transport factor 2 family protein [Nitriliruptor alkaliphilus]|uniref:nuclear transport factor 2 family protein n=1 Tax=Nitriliruptor alkaliphilus TaxID=427918 RepID=UPI00069887BD|nr:nuclear transport factor 2 family protein [Nitriliruptor alkaliphilus]